MTYDYILVGGGSAGCVTANRLVRDHGARVLLLEAGKRDRHPLFSMPAGSIRLLKGSPAPTFHRTVAQPRLDGRTHELPEGHVLGGVDHDERNKAALVGSTYCVKGGLLRTI